jgi:tetratricopeptide (TPR) repeat protein
MKIQINSSSGAKKVAGRAGSSKGRASSPAQIEVACAPQKGAAHDRECACAGIELSDQPEHASSVLDALGIALMNRGCLEEGAKLVEQALRIRRKYFGDDHPLTALSLNSYARVLRERGLLADAEQTAQVAVRINRAAFGDQGYPVAVSLVELGVVNLNQGRYADAETAAIDGLKILARLKLDDTDPNTTRLMDIRGRAEAARGALDIAAKTFEDVLALDKAQGANLPKTATHISNLANIRESQGLFRQAESGFFKTIDAYANKLKRRCHPNLIDTYANLGSMYLSRNSRATDSRDAGKYLKEALRLNLKVRGPNHILVANDYSNLGRLSYQLEDRRGALGFFSLALQIYERNVRRGSIDPNYIFLAEALTWSGRLLVEGGSRSEAAKAEALLERAAKIWATQGVPGTVGHAAANASLGRSLYLQDKDRERARKLLTESYAILRQALGEDYPYVELVRQWVEELDQNSARAA